jgi:hypothetical protein
MIRRADEREVWRNPCGMGAEIDGVAKCVAACARVAQSGVAVANGRG